MTEVKSDEFDAGQALCDELTTLLNRYVKSVPALDMILIMHTFQTELIDGMHDAWQEAKEENG